MKPLTLSDPALIFGIQDEIRRNEESRYDHRLHALLLVAQGMTCPQVAKKFGDARGTVRYWVQRFEKDGFGGLIDQERSGRPRRLSEKQMDEIGKILRCSPLSFGLAANLWDGKTLSAFLKKRWDIDLGVRQCQRLFRQLGFRLRKPRPVIASVNLLDQKRFKKN